MSQVAVLQRTTAGSVAGSRPGPAESGFIEAFCGCLTSQGLSDPQALTRARRAAESAGERIDYVLIKLGLIAETDLACAYGAYCELPVLRAQDLPDRPVLGDRLKLSYLKSNRILPISCGAGVMLLGTVDPFIGELMRLIPLLPDRGLILDLRSNPGGLLDAARHNVARDVGRLALFESGVSDRTMKLTAPVL